MSRADYLGKQFFKIAPLTNSSICSPCTHAMPSTGGTELTELVLCPGLPVPSWGLTSTESPYILSIPGVTGVYHVRVTGHPGRIFRQVFSVNSLNICEIRLQSEAQTKKVLWQACSKTHFPKIRPINFMTN